MTPAEVLQEIQKMPLPEQRQIFVKLAECLNQFEQTDLDPNEEKFILGLKRKGIISEIPSRLPDNESRRHFKRIEVKGEPLSETIIKERG